MTRITSTQNVQAQINESIYRFNRPHEIITQINLINYVHNYDIVGVTRLIDVHKFDGLELHN